MRILEIKNGLVKISYDVIDDLALSGFTIIEDVNTPYVAQIVNLKAESGQNFAVLKLMFTFNEEGILKPYNGTIPSMNATITKLPSEELLEILPVDSPIYLGLLAQQEIPFKLDESVLKSNLLICSNNVDNTSKLLSNILPQLALQKKKALLIDVNGDFVSDDNFTFGRDFKLPLNAQFLDYIFENDLEGVEPVTKAVIQDVFKEVQNYIKMLPQGYLPIDMFINVVDDQYKETGLAELVLLKNKLQKYQENNVFASGNDDVAIFRDKVAHTDSLIVDVSEVEISLQKLLIPYLFDCLETVNSETFVIISMNNDVADKKLLRKTLEFSNIYTTIVCGHEFKYLPDLKQIIQNLLLFAPQTMQHDFANYNTFLGKLNSDEFVVYGPATQQIPFIIQLKPYEELLDMENSVENIAENQPEEQETEEDSDDENIFASSEDNSDFEELAETPAYDEQEINSAFEDNFKDENEIIDVQPEENSEEEMKDNVEDFSDFSEFTGSDEAEEQDYPENFSQEDDETPSLEEDVDASNNEEEVNNDATPFFDNEENQEPISEFEQEALKEREELEEQIAKDVDSVFYTKFEEENLDTENDVNPEVLTDDSAELTDSDLDFIQSMSLDNNDEENEEEETYSSEDVGANLEQEEPNILSNQAIDELDSDNISEFLPAEDEEEATPEPQIVPVYTPEEVISEDVAPRFEAGDVVSHPKYGQGVVEKLIKYGNKTLCSISFVNIGRRLLDPNLSELQLVSRGEVNSI